MIKISNIEINNYRSCIDTKVEINENLTALIGINGAGKSNILNSIQLLKQFNRNRFFHQREIQESLLHSTLKFKLKIIDDDYNLKADIFYEVDERNADYIYSTQIQIKKVSSRKWFKIDAEFYEFYNRIRFHGSSSRVNIKPNKKLTTEIGKVGIELTKYLSSISYYSATQFSDPTKCSASIELDESRPFRGDKSHDKFVYDLYLTHVQDKKAFSRYINTVNKNGIGLIDDISFYEHKMPNTSYEVKTGGRITKNERNKNIVIPSIKLDGLNLSPNQLSEGTFKTLALVFYILNDKSELLLIEEPEVCVHHGLLNSVIELIKMKSKEKQIIISTHSDYILDKLSPQNILLIDKTKEKGTLAKTLSKSLSNNEYDALKTYLNTSGNLGEYWKEGGFENE